MRAGEWRSPEAARLAARARTVLRRRAARKHFPVAAQPAHWARGSSPHTLAFSSCCVNAYLLPARTWPCRHPASSCSWPARSLTSTASHVLARHRLPREEGGRLPAACHPRRWNLNCVRRGRGGWSSAPTRWRAFARSLTLLLHTYSGPGDPLVNRRPVRHRRQP